MSDPKMKVNIDSLRANPEDIKSDMGSKKLVDMTVLKAYDDALRGLGLTDSFDTLGEIQAALQNVAVEADINTLFDTEA